MSGRPARVRASPKPSSIAATVKMRANRRRDTQPELALRSSLHGAGMRFRVDFAVRPTPLLTIPSGTSPRPIGINLTFP